MNAYIATDLIKYIISDYISYNFIQILNVDIFKLNKHRIDTLDGVHYIVDKETIYKINNNSKEYFCKYINYTRIYYLNMYNNKIIYDSLYKKNMSITKRKYYFMNGDLKFIIYRNNIITIKQFYNNGLLAVMWSGNICRFFYPVIYTSPKPVNYWWENYISVEIEYKNSSKKDKLYKKYFDKSGKCTKHIVYDYKEYTITKYFSRNLTKLRDYSDYYLSTLTKRICKRKLI
jgi:hypothetical protein